MSKTSLKSMLVIKSHSVIDLFFIMLILQYKVSFTYDRLGRCFRFVYIYACIAVFLCRYHFSLNKDLCIIDGTGGVMYSSVFTADASDEIARN